MGNKERNIKKTNERETETYKKNVEKKREDQTNKHTGLEPGVQVG